MMPPLNQLAEQWRRRLPRMPRFPLAFGLSLCLHALLLALAGWLVGLQKALPSHIPALVFELVLGPSPRQAKNAGHAKAAAASLFPRSAFPKTDSPQDLREPPIQAPDEPAEMASPPQTESALESAASDNADERKAEPVDPKMTAPILEPLRPLSSAPELVALKTPITSPQRKTVAKKVKEWVSKSIAPSLLDSAFVWKKNGQRFQFDFTHLPAGSATGLDELLVTVTTVDGGDTLSTQMRMRRLAFSQFAQFVDYWDPQVAIHDDEFDGRFHSNSALVLSSSGGTQPKFHGKVTTAGYSVRRAEAGFFPDPREVFLEGIDERADHIPLPRMFLSIPNDTAHVKTFTEEIWLTFHHDGAYTWRSASAPAIEHRATLPNSSYCFIGKGKAKLHVKGVIKGTLLVYSENKIVIEDDLLYARDPKTFSASKDFLGLVSAKDVEIAPPSVTGPGDLQIYAAILAKGRFCVSHIYTRETGTLHVYGSISAGSISATEPRYATRIHFDKRFERMRPPNFPMTNTYEIIEWDERWMVK